MPICDKKLAKRLKDLGLDGLACVLDEMVATYPSEAEAEAKLAGKSARFVIIPTVGGFYWNGTDLLSTTATNA